MHGKFLKNLSLLLFLNLLIKPIWVLVIDREVQISVGNANYGAYSALLSFVLWFSVILDPGLKNYHHTLLARNNQLLAGNISVYLPIKAVLSILYIVLVLASAYLATDLWKHSTLLLILISNQIILSIMLFMRACLSGIGRFKEDSFFSVLDKVLLLLMVAPIFFLPWLSSLRTIVFFTIAHSISYFICTIWIFWLLREHLRGLKFVLSLRAFSDAIKGTYPFAIFTMLMYVYVRTDFVMINQMMPDGDFQTGNYAWSYRLFEAAGMFALLFGNLLLPIFSSLLDNRKELFKLVRLSAGIIYPVALFVALFSWFFKNEVMSIYFKSAEMATVETFGVLMLTFVSTCLFYIFGTLLTAQHKLKILNLLAGIGVAVNIGINYWAIPRFGIEGAAWATLITQTAVACGQVVQVIGDIGWRNSRTHLFRAILYSGAILLGFIALSRIDFSWLLKGGILIALNFTFALLFKILSIKQFNQILKK